MVPLCADGEGVDGVMPEDRFPEGAGWCGGVTLFSDDSCYSADPCLCRVLAVHWLLGCSGGSRVIRVDSTIAGIWIGALIISWCTFLRVMWLCCRRYLVNVYDRARSSRAHAFCSPNTSLCFLIPFWCPFWCPSGTDRGRVLEI